MEKKDNPLGMVWLEGKKDTWFAYPKQEGAETKDDPKKERAIV